MPQYAKLFEDLEHLRQNPPKDSREAQDLLLALRNAEYAVEQPVDTVHRLAWSPIQSSVARTAVDMKLFDIIADKDTPTTISLDDLSKRIGAKPLLLRRLLRLLAAYGMVDEPAPMQYSPNGRTRTMAHPGMQAGLNHNYDIQGAAYRVLPEFLKLHKYDDITDAANTPFQIAHNTDQPSMIWAMTQPAMIQEFSLWMAGLRDVSPSWLDTFPTKYLLQDTTSNSPVFLDIGGSMGHQCQELKNRLPEITRPVILQDQAPVIEVALKTPGVTNEVYDFFTPQPHKDASFYYLKSVCHDWPDSKVLEILKNQISAMGPNSKLLLDEVVLPEKGGHWRAAEMDVALMACAGSFERTEEQWKAIFDQLGLRKVEQHYYDFQMLYAVQIVEKI